MVWKLPAPHDFRRKLLPMTPHDLAMCLGPWWASLGFVTIVSGCVMGTFNFWVLPCAFSWCFCISTFWGLSVIISVKAIYRKYAAVGVPIQGSVVKRWEEKRGDFHTLKHVQVLYQVGQVRYNKEFQWLAPRHQLNQVRINDDDDELNHDDDVNLFFSEPLDPEILFASDSHDELNNDVDLVLLPGYPKSAILYAPMKNLDPDFLDCPVHSRDVSEIIFFSLYPTPLLVGAILTSGEGDAGKIVWIGIGFLVTILLGVAGTYKRVIAVRDTLFHEFVYGAKPAASSKNKNNNTSLEIGEEEDHDILSYEKLCQHHDLPQYRHSYLTVLQIAVGRALWAVYYVAFLGCFLMWYGLAVPLWNRRLLRRYESESDISCVVGSVTCKEYRDSTHIAGVVVLYKAADDDDDNDKNNRFYKKRLYRLSQSSSIPGIRIPDSLELVYLKGIPESAICKKYTLLDPDYAKGEIWRTAGFVVLGLFCMALQIGIPIATFVPDSLYYHFLVGQFVMGFVGVLFRYQTAIQWEILNGDAKQVIMEDRKRSTTTDGGGMDYTTSISSSKIAVLPWPDEKVAAPTTDTGFELTTTNLSLNNNKYNDDDNAIMLINNAKSLGYTKVFL